MKAYVHVILANDLKTFEIDNIIDWEQINNITIVYSSNGDHFEFPSDKCILDINKVKDNEQ